MLWRRRCGLIAASIAVSALMIDVRVRHLMLDGLPSRRRPLASFKNKTKHTTRHAGYTTNTRHAQHEPHPKPTRGTRNTRNTQFQHAAHASDPPSLFPSLPLSPLFFSLLLSSSLLLLLNNRGCTVGCTMLYPILEGTICIIILTFTTTTTTTILFTMHYYYSLHQKQNTTTTTTLH